MKITAADISLRFRLVLVALAALTFSPAAGAATLLDPFSKTERQATDRIVQVGDWVRYTVKPGDCQGACRERAESKWLLGDDVRGKEYWFAFSTYIPSDFAFNSSEHATLTQFLQNSGSPLGIRPSSFVISDGAIKYHQRSGSFNESQGTWTLAPFQKGKRYDVVTHVRFAADSGGFVEVWMNGKQAVNAHGIPTLYGGVPPKMLLKQGFYRGPCSCTSTLYHAWPRMGTSLADASAAFARLPAAPGSSAVGSPPAADPPPPAADPPSPPSPPSPQPAPETSLKVSLVGLRAEQTVRGPVRWEATVSGATPDHVDFLIDGELRATEKNSPYLFNDDGTWDTTTVTDGTHTLTVRAVAADGRSASESVRVRVANAPAAVPTTTPAPASTFQLEVNGPANGEAVRGGVRWEAVPSEVGVRRVEFLVDGDLRWTERNAPYVFNGNNGGWDTSRELNGGHTLTTRVVANDGRVTQRSVRVVVTGGIDAGFSQQPRLVVAGRVGVLGNAAPAGAVEIVVRGPHGGVLGHASARAADNGRVGKRLRLRRWRGQRPLHATMSLRVGAELRRVEAEVALPDLLFVRRPQAGAQKTLRIAASAVPGSRVGIAVRGPQGRLLGLARTKAGRAGRIRTRVALPLWHGQRRLHVTLRASFVADGRRQKGRARTVVRLSPRALRGASAG